MKTSLHALILEDQPDDAELMVIELQRVGFTPTWRRVETQAEYQTQLSQHYDIILSDYSMPQFNALDALEILQQRELDIPFIVVTGSISEEVAVECMKQGASDYLLKDRLSRLGLAVAQALERKGLRDEKRRAEETAQLEAQVSVALAQVGRELISSLTSSVVLDRLCQVTAQVLACDYSTTYLWDPADRTYLAAAGWGWTPQEWEAIQLGEFPFAALQGLYTRLQQDEIVQLSVEEVRQLITIPDAYFRQRGVSRIIYMAFRQGEDIIGIQTAVYCHRHEPCTPQQERIARGIAQLAAMALENARLLEELQRANRIKSDFVATMSHELRTPLNIIMGYTQLLLEEETSPLPTHQVAMLKRIEVSAVKLLELILATLDLSRLEEGRMSVADQVVQLPLLVSETMGEVREFLEKPGLSVRVDIEDELPPLHTDPAKLKIVLKNLLNNAVKFTETGQVTISVRRVDEGAELSVADTGVGIAPEILPHIFDMFRQGDSSASRRYEGVGLGLYIVQRLVALLKGTVSVESSVGQGSIFRVWTPFASNNSVETEFSS